MASLASAVATGLRVVRVTFSAALSDFSTNATGALNLANWSFVAQNVSPSPAAAVAPEAIEQVSTTVVDITVDDDLSPGEAYLVTASVSITGVDASPANRAIFAAVALTPPVERDFSTMRMVPRMNIREDDSGDLERFLRVLDDLLGLQMDRVDHWTDILDYDLAPDNFLDLQLQDLGYPLTIALATIDKRRLLSVLPTIYKQKGTVLGIKNATRFFLGLESDVLWPQWSLSAGWILGSVENELGIDTYLGGTFYIAGLHGTDLIFFSGAGSFDFAVKIGTASAVALTADQIEKATAVIEFMKPAQAHMRLLVAALPPPENVAATAGAGSISISWDAVTGADGYVVFYSPTPDVGAMSPLGYVDPDNVSPYVDTVPTGESRYYVVSARVAGTNGVSSVRVSAIAL